MMTCYASPVAMFLQESSEGEERGGSKASCRKAKATLARRGDIQQTNKLENKQTNKQNNSMGSNIVS